MEAILPLFIVLPLLGFISVFFVPHTQEKLIGKIATGIILIQLLSVITYSIVWLFEGHHSLTINEISIYHYQNYNFFIDFFYDKISFVYLLFSTLLAALIIVYSKYYLHREKGYKRFFNTIFVFIAGINTIVLAGNFETLFVGWELLGMSSFLLIAFYKDRYLPVRNAIKVFTLYRIADLGILLTMWLSHHMWHKNITFAELANTDLVIQNWDQHWNYGLIITLLLILTASIKSAQFPFSFWLPRAMEGPTPSSAIFYGSIAVHIGAFLLLRSQPFWGVQYIAHEVIILIGALSFILCTLTAKVQSSIKSQIAYSSAAQIGLIFIEIALDWQIIALIHLSGNAFFRAYQLLVSPSIVTFKMREQMYLARPVKKVKSSKLFQRINSTLYILSLKEWKLESILYKLLWSPLKKLGNALKKIQLLVFVTIGITLVSALLYAWLIGGSLEVISHLFAGIAVVILVKALNERFKYKQAWVLILVSHFCILLAVIFNEEVQVAQIWLYIIGIVAAGIVGIATLRKLEKTEQFDLNDFYGLSSFHPRANIVFLLSAISLAGFPITTSFIGEDLMFLHIHENQFGLVALISITFVLQGIVVIRLYSRIFLGPNKRLENAKALRGS